MEKSKIATLLAITAVCSAALSSSGAGSAVSASIVSNTLRRRRTDHELEQARQKQLARRRLTKSQKEWNDAIDAKQAAKKQGKTQRC